VSVCVHVCVCVYIYIYIYIYTHTHIAVEGRMVCMCLCTYICVCMYTYMYTHVYIYIQTHTYTHTHTYIHTGEEIYFFGTIDFLQEYGSKKRYENVFKRLFHSKKSISCVSMYVCMYSYIQIHVHECACMYVSNTYIHVLIHSKKSILREYVCVHLCIHIHTHVCVYLCIHIHTCAWVCE
jgi:hypothetical protein